MKTRRLLPMVLSTLVMLTLGSLGMLFALMRDPACAWACALGNAGIFALDLWTDR